MCPVFWEVVQDPPGQVLMRYCQMLWIACHQAAIPEATVATVLVD